MFFWQTNGVGNTIQPGTALTWVDGERASTGKRKVNAFSERENAGTTCASGYYSSCFKVPLMFSHGVGGYRCSRISTLGSSPSNPARGRKQPHV